jgi:hypothetical protein
MIFQCVRSVRCFGIGVLWQFKVINFQMAQEYFQVMYTHDANQPLCLSTSTIAKQAVAKQTSRFQILLYDHDLGDDVDASVRAIFGRESDHTEVVGAPEVNPIPSSFHG